VGIPTAFDSVDNSGIVQVYGLVPVSPTVATSAPNCSPTGSLIGVARGGACVNHIDYCQNDSTASKKKFRCLGNSKSCMECIRIGDKACKKNREGCKDDTRAAKGNAVSSNGSVPGQRKGTTRETVQAGDERSCNVYLHSDNSAGLHFAHP
jgi:hypothetical protein